MTFSFLRGMTMKKFCANCVMLAGALTAVTGSLKSAVDLFSGCSPRFESPAPQMRPVERDLKIRGGPAAIPFSSHPTADTGSHGPIVLESRPEPAPVILYHRVEEESNLFWFWPVVAIGGGMTFFFARRWKRTDDVLEGILWRESKREMKE